MPTSDQDQLRLQCLHAAIDIERERASAANAPYRATAQRKPAKGRASASTTTIIRDARAFFRFVSEAK